jgi:hypothetical protein
LRGARAAGSFLFLVFFLVFEISSASAAQRRRARGRRDGLLAFERGVRGGGALATSER